MDVAANLGAGLTMTRKCTRPGETRVARIAGPEAGHVSADPPNRGFYLLGRITR